MKTSFTPQKVLKFKKILDKYSINNSLKHKRFCHLFHLLFLKSKYVIYYNENENYYSYILSFNYCYYTKYKISRRKKDYTYHFRLLYMNLNEGCKIETIDFKINSDNIVKSINNTSLTDKI